MEVSGWTKIKQIQAGFLLLDVKIHYDIEIAIHSYCIGCEIYLCEIMHDQYIDVYITIVSFIIYSKLCYHVLVRGFDGKGIAGR